MATKILRDEVSASSSNVYLIASSILPGQRTDSIDVIGYNSVSIQCVIANIGTDVKIGLETSLDNISWANTSSSGEWITVTTNGAPILNYTGALRYVRFYFVSAEGGSPTITNVTIFGGTE